MKAFIKPLLICFLSLATSAILIFSSLGFLVSLYAGKPEKADVIIVLGGDNGLRIEKGAELYNAGYSRHVLLTGIDKKFYRPGHPNWRERRMKALGVPKKAIKVDFSSKTTWEEALNASVTMEKRGWKSAIVVSDPPHMLRLHQTWNKALKGSSKKYTLVSTHPDWWHPVFWWENKKSYRFVINEIKKNLFYNYMYF